MISYDCIEGLEQVIKIEHGYLSKFDINDYFRENKDYKTLEKLINIFGKKLPKKEDILYACCEKYNLGIIKLLVEKCDIEVNAGHIDEGCKRGSKKIVNYLLEKFDKTKPWNKKLNKKTLMILLDLDKLNNDNINYVLKSTSSKSVIKKIINTDFKINEDHVINSIENYELFKIILNAFIKQGNEINKTIVYKCVNNSLVINYLVLRWSYTLPIDKDIIESCINNDIYYLLIKTYGKQLDIDATKFSKKQNKKYKLLIKKNKILNIEKSDNESDNENEE